MIIVRLKNGTNVEVPNGVKGEFVRNTKYESIEELIETTLDIRDGTEYSAKIIASFKSDEVMGFTVTPEEE